MKKISLFLIALLSFTCSTFAMTTHTMKSGDTLWALAAKYYGDGTLYTILSKYNNISNPRTIPNGKVIKIPAKSELEDFKKTGKKSSSSQDNKPNNIKPNFETNSSKLADEDLTFETKLEKNFDPKSMTSGKDSNED